MDKEFELILENTCHASKTNNLVNLATSSGATFLQRAEVFCEKNTPLFPLSCSVVPKWKTYPRMCQEGTSILWVLKLFCWFYMHIIFEIEQNAQLRSLLVNIND